MEVAEQNFPSTKFEPLRIQAVREIAKILHQIKLNFK